MRLGACGLCRGARIEYTYNEFNCLVRITYNVFVGGGILAVKPPILSPLSPVSRLPSKTFTLPDPENFFFRSCNLGDKGDNSSNLGKFRSCLTDPINPARVILSYSYVTSRNAAPDGPRRVIFESLHQFLAAPDSIHAP